MSWGNKECEQMFAPKNDMGGCSVATFETCHHECPYFKQEKGMTKTQKRLMREKPND